MTVRVGISIVSYNSAADVADILAGLRPDSADAVVVVDNGSDDTERVVEEARTRSGAPQVQYLRAPGNIGFGAGHNLGIATLSASGCEFAVLVNPDTTCKSNTYRLLIDRMVARGASIASPMIYSGREENHFLWFAGGTIDNNTGQVRHNAYGSSVTQYIYTGTEPVDFVPGTFMGINLKHWTELGGFSEDLFLYWEDIDLCWRAKAAGLEVAYIGDIAVWHGVGGSSAERSGASTVFAYWNSRNRIIIMARLHLPSRAGRKPRRVSRTMRFHLGTARLLIGLWRQGTGIQSRFRLLRCGTAGVIAGYKEAGL